MIEGQIEARKAPTDPTCTRVSVGGNAKVGFYCTYRGTVEESIHVLENALIALKAMQHAKVEAPICEIRKPGMNGRS